MEIPPVNVKSQFSHSESHLKMHVFHCQCRLSILLHPWVLDPWNIMELNELVRCMVMCIRVSGALSFAFMCSEWMISIITMCSEWMISIITIHNLYIYIYLLLGKLCVQRRHRQPSRWRLHVCQCPGGEDGMLRRMVRPAVIGDDMG